MYLFRVLKSDKKKGAGEMVQCLRVLPALVEDPGLVASTHLVAHNNL